MLPALATLGLVVSLEGIVTFIVYLLIAVVVLGLLWWLIGYVEAQGWGPPQAFKVIRVIFVVLIVLLCIAILMSLIGHPLIEFR
jgi:hypothetical protein